MIPVAALDDVADLPLHGPRQHASAQEYDVFLKERAQAGQICDEFVRQCAQRRQQFVRAYPDLEAWFQAPLAERVGRHRGEHQTGIATAGGGRSYLMFLALRGYAWFDWEWLLAMPSLYAWYLLEGTPLAASVAAMEMEAVRLGYERHVAHRAVRWAIGRIYLHTACLDVSKIDATTVEDFAEAVRTFGERPEMAQFFASSAQYVHAKRRFGVQLQLLRVVLYHRGQLPSEPRRADYRGDLPVERPVVRPRMSAVVQRYLSAKRLDSRPKTVDRFDLALGRFVAWLTALHPELDSLGDVTREHALEYAEALDGMISVQTGQPLSRRTKEGYLAGVSVFFRETAAWGWTETPGQPLLLRGELPRRARTVPRYIPEGELARLMDVIRGLPCPYQRTALLVARWSGARRDEIRRLEIDCLDTYPDGTARLRIPSGKTYQERMVPLHEEAASAIHQLQALRRGEPVRGFRDELTGRLKRRLFVHHGKTFSPSYLFESALEHACRQAGLVDAAGRATVTAHRFRHTVGTQLAERGARLHTIMKVLGHQSAGMSVVYAQISDREVLKDYQAVLGPGATLAGPSAEAVRSGEFSASAVEWLKTNFFKTELELGRCLRLPQEGPCECDLYLSCAKFVTTPEYAPRLRRRRQVELTLIEDADAKGWTREVERHHCTVRRLDHLLTELNEPLDGPVDE